MKIDWQEIIEQDKIKTRWYHEVLNWLIVASVALLFAYCLTTLF